MTEKERLIRFMKRQSTILAQHQAIGMANHMPASCVEPERQYLLGMLKAYELIYGTEDAGLLDMYLWERRYRAKRLYLYWMGWR